MRVSASVCAIVLLAAGAGRAQAPAQPPAAQPPLTWPPAVYLNDLGCAPHMTFSKPEGKARVRGSLDPERHLAFATGQTLTVDAGTAGGIQPGQEYFVRRLPNRFGSREPDFSHPASVHTSGWVKIVSADTNVATAFVTHACDAIVIGDYLELFAKPVAQTVLDGTIRYENLGRLLGGDEDSSTAGVNRYMIIDRGSDHGVRPGTRFVVLRDKQEGPLVEIGEGIVLQVRPATSTAQITRARAAVSTGDFVAIAK